MTQSLKLVSAFAVALLMGNIAVWAALQGHSAAAPAPTAIFSTEKVELRTGDGVSLDGVLYRPSAHPRATAILLVHGFGSNFYSGYFPLFAHMAAEQGYTTLSLNMRDHDTGPKVADFSDNEADIGTGCAYLRRQGHSRLVLLGQSMGTNRILYYQAMSRDSSIVATVLVAGPGNLFEWNVWQFGRAKAQASVDEALSMQAGGHEQELMLVDLGPLGKTLYTPRYLLSLRGPNAWSDPYRNIQKVTNPILIIQE